MTLAAGYEPITFTEDGATLLRVVTFPFIDAADLVVVRTLLAGTESTLALNTDYTVTGGNFATGSILLAAGGEDGSSLEISRATPRVQAAAYGDDFPTDTLEQCLDRLTMIAQEQDVAQAAASGVAEHVLAGTGITKVTAGSDVTLSVDTATEAERIRDVIGTAAAAGTLVTVTVNDAGDTITIAVDTAALDERVQDVIAAAIIAGAGMEKTYDDGAGTITIASTGGGGGGGLTTEDVRDTVAAFAVAGSGIAITHDDGANTLTFTVDSAVIEEAARDAVGTAIVAGTGISKTVDDGANTITLAIDTATEAERVRDVMGTALVAGAGINLTVNDGADTITVALADTITSVQVIPFTAGAIVPRAAGGCAAVATGDSGSNDVTYAYLAFDHTTPEYAHIILPMDPMWNEGNIQVQVGWTCAATGDVLWQASACAISDGETLNIAQGAAETVLDSIAVAGRLQVSGYTAAFAVGSTPVENDLLVIEISRKANDGTDTINATDAHLLFVNVKITTSERDDA